MAACTGQKVFSLLRSQPTSLSGAAYVRKRFMASAGQGSKNTRDTKKTPPSAGSTGSSAPPVQPKANVSGATEGYKVKEYFEHNPYSFYDIHADMSKLRMPQPSSRK
ncbi:hypothetical protein HPB49_005301 [Dermacentor silvarum]|uniref:Uncharacterized protein n=1 Tax=Dermacentor silvarum TaxID=543639 RepID=A0ACB8DMW6_DERSI|nr:hypothetical protein HPB49_005301 [Dermacentor silvarum]